MDEVIGWDLDSTVASTVHRRYLIPKIRAGEATWDDYSVLCTEDDPIEGSIELMKLMDEMNPWVRHVAISGRSERAMSRTVTWCTDHGAPFFRYMLRPDGDYTPNGEWKVRCIRNLESEGYRVRLFFEDWDQTAKYIREHAKVPVVGINPFDPDSALVTREQLAVELEQEIGPEGMCFEPGSGPEVADRIFSRLGGSW